VHRAFWFCNINVDDIFCVREFGLHTTCGYTQCTAYVYAAAKILEPVFRARPHIRESLIHWNWRDDDISNIILPELNSGFEWFRNRILTTLLLRSHLRSYRCVSRPGNSLKSANMMSIQLYEVKFCRKNRNFYFFRKQVYLYIYIYIIDIIDITDITMSSRNFMNTRNYN